MTTDTQHPTAVDPKNPISFGVRLKSAREALGLERKDAADQLRLTEKIIIMMEKDRYPNDLPVTFIKGYLRAYAKLLQIPDHEIKKAVEPIKQKPGSHESAPILITHTAPVTSGSYFMQLLTYLIIFTLMALVAIWWYTHNPMTRNEQASALDDLPAAPPPTASVQTLSPTSVAPTQTAGNSSLPGQPATEREKMVESTANAASQPIINPVPIENRSDTVSAPADNNIINPQQAIGMQATVQPKTTTQPDEGGYDDDEDDGDDSEI